MNFQKPTFLCASEQTWEEPTSLFTTNQQSIKIHEINSYGATPPSYCAKRSSPGNYMEIDTILWQIFFLIYISKPYLGFEDNKLTVSMNSEAMSAKRGLSFLTIIEAKFQTPSSSMREEDSIVNPFFRL